MASSIILAVLWFGMVKKDDEIWQYYNLPDGQRNKKFVFYTIDIVTNDFQLVHSDAIGETSNYRWQVEIYKRTYLRLKLSDNWDNNNWD